MKSTIAKAIEKFINGESKSSIAKDIGCYGSTVARWIDKYYLYKNGTKIITKKSKV